MLEERVRVGRILFLGLICPGAVLTGLLGVTILPKNTIVQFLTSSGKQAGGVLGVVPTLLFGLPFTVVLGLVVSAVGYIPTLLVSRVRDGFVERLKTVPLVKQGRENVEEGLNDIADDGRLQTEPGIVLVVMAILYLAVLVIRLGTSLPGEFHVGPWSGLDVILPFLFISILYWRYTPPLSDVEDQTDDSDESLEWVSRLWLRLTRPFRSRRLLLRTEVQKNKAGYSVRKPVKDAINILKNKESKSDIESRRLFEDITRADSEHNGGTEWLDDSFVELARSTGTVFFLFGFVWILLGIDYNFFGNKEEFATLPIEYVPTVLRVGSELTIGLGVGLLVASTALLFAVPAIKMSALVSACRTYCERHSDGSRDDDRNHDNGDDTDDSPALSEDN